MNITFSKFTPLNNKNKPCKQAISFKGYGACPLKSLYLQSNNDPDCLTVAKEVKKIGLKENFDVFIQIGKELINPDNYNGRSENLITVDTTIWSQDKRLVLEREGSKDSEIAIGTTSSGSINGDLEASTELANSLNLPIKEMRSVLEGGNCYILKNNKNEKIALIGKTDRLRTAKKIALEEIGEDASRYDKLENIYNNKELDFKNNQKQYEDKATLQIAKDLNIKPENVHFISQPAFHIDMAVRPLNYPYVLINDFNYSQELLEKAKNKTNNQDIKKQIEEIISNTEYSKKIIDPKYANMDIIENELTEQGFKVIRVPGILNYAETNFMNAIVQQKFNGDLVYITNKSPCVSSINLNNMFEKVLKQKAPQVKKVYFVAGQEYRNNNYISYTLDKKSGGIHCMVCEHPDFLKWNTNSNNQ